MKWLKRLLIILVLAIVAALGILFWPKIRETWDRRLASGKDERQEPPG